MPHPRAHPYQYHDTPQASEMRANVWQTHTTGSPLNHPPVASSSQIMLEDLESVTSTVSPIDHPPVASSSQTILEDLESATPPSTDSDTYYSLPNTPASASWTPSEGLDRDPQVRTRGMRFVFGPFVWARLIFVLL